MVGPPSLPVEAHAVAAGLVLVAGRQARTPIPSPVVTIIRAALEPVDPAHFVPWPLAPGARIGWRDGGRFCAFLLSDLDMADDHPARPILEHADLDPWHTTTAPALDGGTVSVGELVDETGRLGWGRATRLPAGVMVAGHVLGVEGGARPTGYPAGRWKREGEGFHLAGVGWFHGAARPGPTLGEVRRALEEQGRRGTGG